LDTFGRIDFVICGAAGNFLAPIEGVSPNGFATVQQIDLQGTFNTVKATLAEMKRTHGVYTHISATLHYTAIPWQAAASAAKAGIDALSQSIAVEMGPFGIRSNVIAPGMISGTEGADRLTPKGGESLVESRIPQQRVGVIVSRGMLYSVSAFFDSLFFSSLHRRMTFPTWACSFSRLLPPTARVLSS